MAVYDGTHEMAAVAGALRGGVSWGRRLRDRLSVVLSMAAVAVAVIPLGSILLWVARQGLSAIDWEFLTSLPKPVGEPGGGMANAIVGTVQLVTFAGVMAVPVGVLAGVFLSEFGNTRLAEWVRAITDALTGVPSIVVGIFAYTVLVRPTGHFSGWAGSFALAVLMLPVVTRTTEEMIRLVPHSIREASLALGVPMWRTVLSVIIPSALPGIVTGVLLALARVAGETAPLLFTALGNRFWPRSFNEPVAALPLQLYVYAKSPYEDWHRQAWGAALVLVGMVLVTSILARLATARTAGRGGRS
ncbi:phosphate ABC transporter permease PstA [Carboxydochorda subterranea]|uniref:Phosphate transport system permease protein PstA n=1 Tax=Carboxydichorda subterranea TaxID=3109565 RepID=A0ABZ1BTJ4_9FIRM|nr:phosphate ABC transporter permease PstA [Limnochorda sp. L945t]WRP16137.1 phosphate ABC transporter permease PstA [Limnochorda sp. L945t]